MSRAETLAAIARARAVAIMRAADTSLAADALDAAIRGGLDVVEITMNTPGATELIATYAARDDVACVGAGTVLTTADAHAAVRAGARFLVSPVCDERVIAAARELDAVAVPGTHTPTEMQRAHGAGAELVKLFPAGPGGPDYVRSILGPLPHLRIVPTNGVDAGNAAAYLEAGAFAVGFVRAVFAAELMARRDVAAIEERARAIREAIATARCRDAGHDV